MNGKYLILFCVLLTTLGFLFISCDGDENVYVKDIEGHWIYVETKADVYVSNSDDTLKAAIEEYIENRYNPSKVSYEFKNDKTYYYYQNYAEPIKGIYKIEDKKYFKIDDSRGEKTALNENGSVYVISDLKSEVAEELGIDANKIVKATATDVFEKGLFTR